jgi:thioredoxin-related protein
VLDATKSKFRDVAFETVDLTDRSGPNQEIAGKYGITGIPHVVFLDASSKVLYSDTPPFSADGFEAVINQFH